MRTSSRRSDPGASKRSKVSEPRPAGPAADPPAPLYHQGTGHRRGAVDPARPVGCRDRWMVRAVPGGDGIAYGCLSPPPGPARAVGEDPRGPPARGEVQRGQPGHLRYRRRGRGRIELWRKWSFPFGPLGPGDAGPPGWTVVHKRRWISQFFLAGGRLAADIPISPELPARATEPACAVELTEVHWGGETWWSLGFEATGPAELLRGTLQAAAALIFGQAPPGDVELDLSHCQSYVEWLSRRREIAPNHPPEGEEYPPHRRQDQSPSHDQRREGRTESREEGGTPWLT